MEEQADVAVGLGDATPSAFVGRAPQLDVLRTELARAEAGHGRLVLVTGEPGIGKTTLVDTFAEEARQRGARVVWSAAWEGGGAPAYWPWVQVLRELAPELQCATDAPRDLTPLHKLVPEVIPASGGSPGGDGERFALFDAVAGALELAATAAPLVVIVEDLHAAGIPSALMLQFVARHLHGAPVLVVATYRGVEARLTTGLGEIVSELEAAAGVVELPAMSRQEVHDLVASAQVDASEDLLAAIVERTRGNPLFVTQVARLLGRNEPADVPIPGGIQQAVRHRLDRLADTAGTAREALTVGAVLGAEVDLAEVAAVLDTAVADLQHTLTPAVISGLLVERGQQHCRFAHALVRAAIYDGLSSADRASVQHRVARVLAQRHAAAARVAHHLLAALPVSDAREAVRYATLAGADATAALAYEEAAEHYRHAVGALAHVNEDRTRQRCELLLSLADALIKAADIGNARPLLVQATEHARRCNDGELLARAALLRSHHLEWHVVDHDAIALLEEAVHALAGDDSPMLVQLLSRLAFALQHSDPERMVEVADRAVGMARRMGDPATLVAAISGRMHSRWGRQDPADGLAEADELTRLARRSGDSELLATALTWRFHYGLVRGDLLGVRAATAELHALAETSRQPFLQLVAATRAATLAMVAGHFDEAMELAERAWLIGTRAEVPDADGFHWGQLFGCWVIGTLSSERERRMMRLLDGHLAVGTASVTWLSSAMVLVELARDQRDRASARFESLAAGVESSQRESLYQSTLAVLAEGCVRLGAREHAERLYDMLLPYADRIITGSGVFCLGSGHHYLAGLAALAGRREEADRHYRCAVEQHRRAGAAGLLARSEREYDRFQQAQGTPAAEPESAEMAAEFRRTGQIWQIRWDGDLVSVPDSKGMRDLAVLLAAPEREVSVLDLVETAGGPAAAAAGGDLGERLDAKARAAYRQRLDDLEDELAEAKANADSGRLDAVHREREFLVAELSGALGLGGRARLEGDPVERARKAVTMRIRTAIKRIGKASPALARHLDRSVMTGRMCAYRPEHPVTWLV